MMVSQVNDKKSPCSVCHSTNILQFTEILNVPVHCNLLWSGRDEAVRAARGDLQLGFCNDCGHIFNLAFNPAAMQYDQAYENSLHFSPRFQDYAESLAAKLIARYDLHGKQIVEIGCGHGDFLGLLCELGENCGVGFDPGPGPHRNGARMTSRMRFIQDFYSERYAGYEADLICCRHVLEHLPGPLDFVSTLRKTIGSRIDTVVFFEVPNVIFSLRHCGIWDLIYEHCSYFSIASLERLFSSCGFEVSQCAEAFGGQFLCIEALPGAALANSQANHRNEVETMAQEVVSFGGKFHEQVENWRRKLETMEAAGQRVVMWGGGSKGVAFLNALQVTSQISYVVDINPYKHGKYIAGTGQRIVPPEHLVAYQPDIVLVMNPIYRTEISRQVEKMHLSTELISV